MKYITQLENEQHGFKVEIFMNDHDETKRLVIHPSDLRLKLRQPFTASTMQLIAKLFFYPLQPRCNVYVMPVDKVVGDNQLVRLRMRWWMIAGEMTPNLDEDTRRRMVKACLDNWCRVHPDTQDQMPFGTPIDTLPLPIRITNALKRVEITTIESVLEILLSKNGEGKLLAIRHFGETSLFELKQALKNGGYLDDENDQI